MKHEYDNADNNEQYQNNMEKYRHKTDISQNVTHTSCIS